MHSRLNVSMEDNPPMPDSAMPQRPAAVVSPLQAIQNIVQRRLTGRLTVRRPGEELVLWRVHLSGEQLHFADSLTGQKERLTYVLHRTFPEALRFLPKQPFPSTYGFLCECWHSGHLDLSQVRRLISLLSHEALVHVMAMPQAILQFDRNIGLDPILMSMPFKDCLPPLTKQVRGWQSLYPYIYSPLQRLYLADVQRFVQDYESQLDAIRGRKAKTMFVQAAIGQQPCLYELAVELDTDLLQLATALTPAIQSSAIALRSFATAVDTHRPVIACIDDSPTVQRNVRLILEAAGYRVLGITDPLRALSSLVREKPVLVLMDITMPDLDGYELCRMLRQASALRHIPIVMLTGRDGLLDRMRARLVGASDYITKPFNTETLMGTIHKFVHLEVAQS